MPSAEPHAPRPEQAPHRATCACDPSATRPTEGDADVGISKIRSVFLVEHEATGVGSVGTPDHLALHREKGKLRVDAFYLWATETSGKVLLRSPFEPADGTRQRFAKR